MVAILAIIIVIFIVYKVVSGISSSQSSNETGKEVRHIAIKELGIPEDDYYKLVMNPHSMERLKHEALLLQNHPDYKDFSWSRTLSHAIYNKYKNTR